MPLVMPERTVAYPGKEYGMVVLDPSDGRVIFNAKYPIFGSDITNPVPQIVTRRITITNSSGKFNEPANPSFSYVNDGNWRTVMYNQLDNMLVATIPHGQKKQPVFMATGFAYIQNTQRLRYYHQNTGGGVSWNSIYIPEEGSRTGTIKPGIGRPESLLPYPMNLFGWTYNNVGPFTGPEYGNPPQTTFTITADDTNIYIRATLTTEFRHQSWNYGSSGGFRRYEKFWSNLTGSWYEFTFYILPYDKDKSIFIR